MGKDTDRILDEIAVLEYRAGNLDALGALISRWQTRLHVYLAAMLGSQNDAWDVSQEVWLAVISALRRKTDIRDFPAWLYAIARNKCFTHMRGAAKACGDDEALDEQPAGEDTLDLVISAEDARLIGRHIAALPVPQREALVLFYVDSLSVSQIAAVQSVPMGTVQSRLFHARRRLKETLSRKGYGDANR